MASSSPPAGNYCKNMSSAPAQAVRHGNSKHGMVNILLPDAVSIVLSSAANRNLHGSGMVPSGSSQCSAIALPRYICTRHEPRRAYRCVLAGLGSCALLAGVPLLLLLSPVCVQLVPRRTGLLLVCTLLLLLRHLLQGRCRACCSHTAEQTDPVGGPDLTS